MPKQYTVNEIFLSTQGEGARAGTQNVFLRFTGCNLQCSIKPGPLSPGGFDCDTEFQSGRKLTAAEIVEEIHNVRQDCRWVIMTGGEPALQIDSGLLAALKAAGLKLAVETNGSKSLPAGIDYIAVSPKVAEHCIRQVHADEVRYVRGYGQAIPKTAVRANRKFISPAFSGTTIDSRAEQWCRDLVAANPSWELSIQNHKLAGMR